MMDEEETVVNNPFGDVDREENESRKPEDGEYQEDKLKGMIAQIFI